MKVTLVGLVFLVFVASSALGQELTTAENFLTSAGYELAWEMDHLGKTSATVYR